MSEPFFEPVTNAAPVPAMMYEKLRIAFEDACKTLAEFSCAESHECPDGFSVSHCSACPYEMQESSVWQSYFGKRAEEACSSEYHKRLFATTEA